MATKNGNSGRFDITTHNQYINGYVTWQETYDDTTYINTLETTVTMDVYLHRTNNYASATTIDSTGQRIGYYGSESNINNDRLVFSIAPGGAYTKVFTTSKKIKHNSDGTKNIDIGFSMSNSFGATAFTVSKQTKNVTLMTIPRYATSNQSLASKTETTIKMNWSSDNTVDALWYSTNDGSSWTKVSISEGKSGSYTISGLKANTLYNVKTRVRRKDSQLTTDSSKLQVTTYDYPYCTESPNFSIGQELTLKLYNPLGRLVTIKFIGAGDQVLSTDETSMTTAKGYNSASFIDKLYKSIPNSLASPYKISVTYGSNTYTRNNNNTYNIAGTEANPTFNNFTYKDSNANVTAVTGNNQVLVKGKSTVEVTISSANKMVANKYATPNKYTATIDSLTGNAEYSTSDVVFNVGTVNSAGTKRLNVRAYDSRYNYKDVYKDVTVYDYAKPVINVDITRLNNFENETTLKVSGTYTRLTINDADKNSISSVEYRYRETGSNEWSNWATIKTTITSGKFTCNDVILDLDNSQAFDIEVRATDKLDSNIASGSVDVGKSIFFIDANGRKCYVNDLEVSTGISGKASKNLYPCGLTQMVYAPLISLPKGTYTITEIDSTSGNWYFKAYKNGSPLSSGVSFDTAFSYSSGSSCWYRADTTLQGFTFTLSEDYTVQIGRLNATGTQKVQLEKGSVATGYEPYYESSVSVQDANGNYHDVPYATGKASKNIFNAVVETGGYNKDTGVKTSQTDCLRNKTFIKVEPNTAYIFSNNGVGMGMNVLEYDENCTFIQCNLINKDSSFTTTSTTRYINCFRSTSAFDKPQLEKGSTITSYEEYYKPTLSIKDSEGNYHDAELNEVTYSSKEQKIGTWINGKPLYRKVLTYSTKITSGTTQIAHGISNLDTVVKCDYMAKWDGKNYPAPIIYSEYSKQVIVNYIGSSYVYVKSFGETWDAYTLTIILEYTKS